MDVLRQRRRRRNGCHLDELHHNVQAECGRAVRLVPGCAVAHSDTPHQPNRRATAAQLEGPRTGRQPSLKSNELHNHASRCKGGSRAVYLKEAVKASQTPTETDNRQMDIDRMES